MTSPASEAADPTVSAERLAELARDHPETRVAAALNPIAYAGLLEWLGSLGDPQVDDALRRRDATLARRASDPATTPAELAILAAEVPTLREAVSANPSAYEGLRAWIAAQQPSADPVQVVVVASASVPADATADVAAAAVATAAPASARFAMLRGIPFVARIAIAAVLAVAVLTATGFAVVPHLIPTASQPTATHPSKPSTPPAAAVVPAVAARYVPTVLILDASGSMIRDVPGGGTRMDAARSAATTLVQGFGDAATVGLIVFGTSTGNKDSDRAAGCSDVRRLIPVGPIDKRAFTAAISGITQSGFTPLGPALNDAAAQLGDAQTGLIVLVTDGVDTCAPPSACDIAAQIRSDHPGFTIQTVGFAVDADEQAQEDLACIAQAGGGEFVDAGNATQLAARLRALTDPVSTAGALTSHGLDQLQIGMSLADARNVVTGFKLGKLVVEVQYVQCDQGTLLFSQDRLVGIIPKKKIATADGVKIGDPLGTATAIYGAGTAGSDSTGAFETFPTSPGADTGYAMYVAGTADAATKILRITLCLCGGGTTGPSEISAWKIGFGHVGPVKIGMALADVWKLVPDPGPAAQWVEGCDVTSLSVRGVGSSVGVIYNDSGTVVGLFVAQSSLSPSLPPSIRAGSTFAAVRASYPDVQPLTDFEVPGLTLSSGSQKIWLIGDGPDAQDRVGDIQIGTGAGPAPELCG